MNSFVPTKQTDPLITIFIPTYRRPELLKKAIESALAQTWGNLRVIVSDNASEDETSEIVQRIAKRDSRVHYIRHACNKGLLGNYEFGMSVIETPYFSFLSDDDFLFPCFCENAMKGFVKHSDAIFSAGATLCMSKEKKIVGRSFDAWSREGRYDPPQGLLAICYQIPPPNTILFRKEAVNNIQLDRNNTAAWDIQWILQLAAKFPFVISKVPCGVFVNHEGSFSNATSVAEDLKMTQRLICQVRTFSALDIPVRRLVEKLLRLRIYKSVFNVILVDCQVKRIACAKKNARDIFRAFPVEVRTLPYAICIFACMIFPAVHSMIFKLKILKKRIFFFRCSLVPHRRTGSGSVFEEVEYKAQQIR